MESSTGKHYVALDQVRALAAFLVLSWHFMHGSNGWPIPFAGTPSLFLFAVLDEGHTGVALFMTLSGYLFAKLLDGQHIHYRAFLWNRVLRLAPLLLMVMVVVGVQRYMIGESLFLYAKSLVKGLYFWSWPNGGWSITVEFHFYLLLPLLLWFVRKSPLLLLLVLLFTIFLRYVLYLQIGQIQMLAYWTIIGRIDQFVLGIMAYQYRHLLTKRHFVFAALMLAFLWFYYTFDKTGGLYMNPSYPSSKPLWIVMPTVEGLAYAIGIAYFDSSYAPSKRGLSGLLGRIGSYSYSIYLLHFFVVFAVARFINDRIMDLSNFYVALFWSLLLFLLMAPVGYLSFRYIESPFLKYRKRYIVSNQASELLKSGKVAKETA